MKTFKTILKELYEPKAGDEKRFFDQHMVRKFNHLNLPDYMFNGEIEQDDSREADQKDGEDEDQYDLATNMNYDGSEKRRQVQTMARQTAAQDYAAEETEDFMGAAAAAKAAGKDTFEFGGKTYPVTMDDEVADDINEYYGGGRVTNRRRDRKREQALMDYHRRNARKRFKRNKDQTDQDEDKQAVNEMAKTNLKGKVTFDDGSTMDFNPTMSQQVADMMSQIDDPKKASSIMNKAMTKKSEMEKLVQQAKKLSPGMYK